MQFYTRKRRNLFVNVVSLIDILAILLIFFIVTTTFVDETGVEVDKPQAARAAQLEKTSIMIALTKKGEVVYGGREIGINGVQPLVKRMSKPSSICPHLAHTAPVA